MIEFEWDPDKAKENLRKHRVSFEFATQAFRDPFGVERADDRLRRILTVAFTERGDRVRLISARRATRHEQDIYYRENGA